jgi:hypothetical protein
MDRPCIGAIASCPSSDAGLCDPVCNTRCGQCFEKCSVNAAGALTCNAPTAGSPGLLESCAQTAFGAMQTDNCAPGQVCIAPRGNQCFSRCYQFCRTSSDCTNGAACSIDAGGGNSLCDVPPAACDPVLHAAGIFQYSHCPGTNLVGCYLSSDTLTTLCDCQDTPPANSTGRIGESCVRSRDCFAGLICYDPTGHDNKTCRKVCRLPGDGGVDLTRVDAGEQGCSNDPKLCLPILLPNGTLSTTFGFCND